METRHIGIHPSLSFFSVSLTVVQWEIDDQNYDSIKQIKFRPQQ